MKQTGFAGLRRVGFIDELRGFDVVLMVLYHALYDLVYIFGVEIPIFHTFFMPYVQPFIAGVFIVLSGISCRYSRNNIKRGIKTLMLGFILTAATLIFIPGEAIYFGILHFMGTAMMLFALIQPILDKVPAMTGLAMSVVAYVYTLRLPQGMLGFGDFFTIRLPERLYTKAYLLPLGFAGAGSDYFPLAPYFFMYLAGSFLGVFFRRDQMPGILYDTRSKLLPYIGRHTLAIYMLHQPVIMAGLSLYFWIYAHNPK